MSLLRIGDRAPDFKAQGILGGQVGDYSPASYKGKWLVLFFYPADFTFICPTEVTGFSKMAKAFADEGAAILGVSVDSIDSHRSWAEELGGLQCPLLSD
jgi:peroxiredoxin (alkyl hydroperoxide reductase subunit C)